MYLTTNKLFPVAQSSYRKYHSNETALLKVKNDLLMAMNRKHVSLLVLLDLSAAFDHSLIRIDLDWVVLFLNGSPLIYKIDLNMF